MKLKTLISRFKYEKVKNFLNPINFHIRFPRFVSNVLFSELFIDKNHGLEKLIFLNGTGRSGSSWLSELLAEYFHYRIINEPFRPRQISYFKPHFYRLYIPPDEKNSYYKKVFDNILSGNFKKNASIDLLNLHYKTNGTVVKSIRTQNSIKWLRNQYPDIPFIYFIRHPCAVVLSKLQLNWDVAQVIDRYLIQKDFIDEFFPGKREFIEQNKTGIKGHTIHWCLENYIVLKMIERKDCLVVTYEYLNMNLLDEMEKIIHHIDPKLKFKPNRVKNVISRSSSTSLVGTSPKKLISKWKTKLTDDQISTILDIVKEFNLDRLYNRELLPNLKFLESPDLKNML